MKDAYISGLKKFVFTTGPNSEGVRVCEGALISLLALGSTDLSEAPRQWRDIKKEVVDGTDEVAKEIKNESYERFAGQISACTAFISEFIEDCDPMPTAGGEHIRIVPFLSVRSFHEEFKAHYILSGEDESKMPSESTFLRAWNSFNGDVRLMRCKGNFSTCELCANATELLKKANKYGKAEREIILQYRRQHLKQQARQRDALEAQKMKSMNDYGPDGQPTQFLLFSDAITATRGETPYMGKENRSKEDDKAPIIENRTVGVEVYCGPIRTTFLYHLDEFPSGGANTMIEIQRQALNDLAGLLKEKGLLLPKKGHFQFDNCGENKVCLRNYRLLCTHPHHALTLPHLAHSLYPLSSSDLSSPIF